MDGKFLPYGLSTMSSHTGSVGSAWSDGTNTEIDHQAWDSSIQCY